LNFHQQNPPKNQYLPQLISEIYEIKFIKSNSLTAFQQHQESPPNSNAVFQFSFYLTFMEEMIQ
jgi:hypothetical protein